MVDNAGKFAVVVLLVVGNADALSKESGIVWKVACAG